MPPRRKLSVFELRCIAADAACDLACIQAYMLDRAGVARPVATPIDRAMRRLIVAWGDIGEPFDG